jgi:peptidoglycan/xylan/chitin deacetylase (PgdA/CDA1 family)
VLQELSRGFFKGVASGLSWTPRGSKLTVLIYHRVLAESDPLLLDEPDERVFGWQMAAVAKHFRVLPLGEAIERLMHGRLDARSACITFDDGYADNFTGALPILRKLGLTATFFVATGSVDGGRMWNDSIIEALRVADSGELDLRQHGLGVHALGDAASRRSAIAKLIAELKYRPPGERERLSREVASSTGKKIRDDLMMTSDQVAALCRAGMEIGAHTVSHSLLSKLTDHDARREMAESRARLESICGCRVRVFAYPNGKPGTDYTERDVALLRDLEFAAAVSTAWGAATPASDPLQVPRFTPWDRTPSRFLARLLQNYLRTNAVCV